MQKFNFSILAPAKVANLANHEQKQIVNPANLLLKPANAPAKAANHLESSGTLANFSKPLASDNSLKIFDISKISRFSSSRPGETVISLSAHQVKRRNTIEEQIRELWKQTEQLADWIDYSDTPIEERWAKLPEFKAMTIRIDELIKEQARIDQEKKQQMDFSTAHKQMQSMVHCLHGQSCSFLRGNSCLKASGQSIFNLNKCPLPKAKWFRVRHDGE